MSRDVSRAATVRFGILAALVASLGCGGQTPVQGVITLDGRPLPKAHVVLSPIGRTGAGPFVADTDGDGRFALGPIGRPAGGVLPGRYRLTVSTAFSMDSDAPSPKELVPAPYVRGVDHEVLPGGDNAIALELTSTPNAR